MIRLRLVRNSTSVDEQPGNLTVIDLRIQTGFNDRMNFFYHGHFNHIKRKTLKAWAIRATQSILF